MADTKISALSSGAPAQAGDEYVIARSGNNFKLTGTNLLGGNWKQTSYNGKHRKHYAGIGYTYDEGRDAFIPPQPYPSWSLDSDCNWQAPVPMPDDGAMYTWDEAAQAWIASEAA